MSKAEAFEVNFGENKSIGVNVNFSKGDAIQVPVSINSLDAEKVAKEVGDRIAEKLDETALASVAKENTLLMESQRIQDAVRNIDLTPIENKVQEGVNILSSKIDNIDLSAVENKVREESAAIQAKIDNIELPEIDTSAIAKQGENAEATNSAILDVLGGIATTMYKGVPVVHLYPSAGGTDNFTIQPNQYTIVHEVKANIVLNKGEDLDGIVNHYMVRLENSGGAINSVTFGGFSLKWLGGTAPNLGAEGIFEISIINDLALYTKL
jgi:hypothetical protein